MAVRFDQGRKRWVVEFEQSNIRIFRRLPKGCARAQAESLEGQLRREIFDRESLDKRADVSLRHAIDQWLLDTRRKNTRKAQSEAKQWDGFVGTRMLKEAPEVASEAIRAWRKPMAADKGKPPSLATIDRRLAMLKAVCKYAWEQRMIGENMSARIKLFNPPNEREVYLSRAQVKTLAKYAPSSESKAAIILLAYTGLRVSELLCQPAVERRSAMLSVSRTTAKNKKSRLVPVPAAAQSYLRALPLPLSYWRFRKEFIAACKASGVKGVRIHDLRHTYASWLAANGEDLYTIAKLLGDELQSAKRYTHLIKERLVKAVAGLK